MTGLMPAWPRVVPPVPDVIWSLTDEPLRRQARAAWDAAHTVINAAEAWEAWIRVVTPIGWESAGPGFVEEANERGDAIALGGRKALITLQMLALQVPVFRPDADDPNEGTILEHNTPLKAWPIPPKELVDVSWYFGPSPAERKLITGGIIMMEATAREARDLVELLKTIPENAFQRTDRLTDSTSQAPAGADQRQSDRNAAPKKSKAGRKSKSQKTTNELMTEKLESKPESRFWTITEWMAATGRSKGSIGETPTWRKLETLRQSIKAETRLNAAEKGVGSKRRR